MGRFRFSTLGLLALAALSVNGWQRSDKSQSGE